jgi:hypothetical protein
MYTITQQHGSHWQVWWIMALQTDLPSFKWICAITGPLVYDCHESWQEHVPHNLWCMLSDMWWSNAAACSGTRPRRKARLRWHELGEKGFIDVVWNGIQEMVTPSWTPLAAANEVSLPKDTLRIFSVGAWTKINRPTFIHAFIMGWLWWRAGWLESQWLVPAQGIVRWSVQ